MPHSLRAKIKGLRYKGIITDKDCDRLCKALDNENVLDKIRAEIESHIIDSNGLDFNSALYIAIEIINNYTEKERVNDRTNSFN